jgi:bacterioferritin
MRAYPVTALLQDRPLQHDGVEVTARLDDALSTKLVGVLRCRRHHFMARRQGSMHATDMFLAHSNAEQAHADAIAQRMVDLGADPEFSPSSLLCRSHVIFFEHSARLKDMAQEDLDALRVTDIELTVLMRSLGSSDAVTRRLLLSIIKDDQARARTLGILIASLART